VPLQPRRLAWRPAASPPLHLRRQRYTPVQQRPRLLVRVLKSGPWLSDVADIQRVAVPFAQISNLVEPARHQYPVVPSPSKVCDCAAGGDCGIDGAGAALAAAVASPVACWCGAAAAAAL